MGKVKKFRALGIKKIMGGKNPVSIVEEFLLRLGVDPDECKRESSNDFTRWVIELDDEPGELEVLLESLTKESSTTVYLGINILTIPLKGAYDVMASALKIADGLVGIKVSIVGHELVLSASLAMSDNDVDQLDYHFRLINAQSSWFKKELMTELGWEYFPES
jgi:hypothetical protein